jgi:uncharacterized protein YjlB
MAANNGPLTDGEMTLWSGHGAVREEGVMEIESIQLAENGWVPTMACPSSSIAAWSTARARGRPRVSRNYSDHGWPPDWRDGIKGYHHYHSTALEALGISAGRATLELGGPDGRKVEVCAGDALMLPTGTGHRCIEASADFLVVGAYPEGQDWDICREAPNRAARQRMLALPYPDRDPVTGASTLGKKA